MMTRYINIQTRCKMHEHWDKPFFCQMDKIIIPSQGEYCKGKCHNVCTLFLKVKATLTTYPIFLQKGNFSTKFEVDRPNGS